jgi:hypothetical protein
MKKACVVIGSYKKRLLMIGLILVSVVYVGNSTLKADWTGNNTDSYTFGRVGIGTNSPQTALDVAGDIQSRSSIGLATNDDGYNWRNQFIFFNAGRTQVQHIFYQDPKDNNSLNLMTNVTAGVKSAFNIYSSEVNINGGITIKNIGVPLTFKETDNTSPSSLWRMPLDAGVLRFDVSNDNATTFTANYTTPLQLFPDGSATVGTDLRVQGTITSGSTISAANYTCSDVRFKKDITPLTSPFDKISSLNGVTYHWKKNEFKSRNFDDRLQIGFIAQDVEKVFPELVYTGKDGYKSVSYDKFTVILVEAMKELNLKYGAKISALETENQELKVKLASLEDMGKRLERLEAMVKVEKGERVAGK